ncbi:hypothetical protein E4U43_001305 [Claviceps pusilla]|uniref:Shikimate dehydrogenase substrate binding N-terminal domain-containing protein n=1 Tax=Claviceps pusilla TaxID=123648 RepID=A0A9P7SZD8_9HYPO|nr:hypothetical protein E4U43_001305 [Claviceps pusilla]
MTMNPAMNIDGERSGMDTQSSTHTPAQDADANANANANANAKSAMPSSSSPTDHARHSFLFGQHITHSLSPFLHQLIYEELGLPWRQIRLDSSDVEGFVRRVRDDPACFGASVTMPNKVAVLAYLDEVTAECRDVGACNTVYVREEGPRDGDRDGTRDETREERAEERAGRAGLPRRILCGTNTDVVGIREALRHSISPADMRRLVQGRPALVVGAGGAARSAVYALRRWLPVGDIYLVNRDAGEVQSVMADCCRGGYGSSLRHLATPEDARGPHTTPPAVVISCVPDLEPRTEEERLACLITEELLQRRSSNSRGGSSSNNNNYNNNNNPDTCTRDDDLPRGLVLDMCYHPTPHTRLVALASRLGWHVILGTEPAIWQGLEQDRYWTGLPVEQMPLRKVQHAMREQVAQRNNWTLHVADNSDIRVPFWANACGNLID